MKRILLISVISLLATVLFGVDKQVLISDFSKPEQFQGFNLTVATASEDGKTLSIDTTNAPKNRVVVFETKGDLFKAGKKYTATIKYTLDNPDLSKIVRMLLIGKAGNEWFGHYNMGASKKTSIAKFTFQMPENSQVGCFRLDAEGKFKAKIKSIKIVEGDGENFIPATADAKPYTAELKNLPTGAKEFDVELPKPTNNIVINAADFGVNAENENCAVALNKAFEEAKKQKASKVILPKGVYKFYSDTTVKINGMTDFTFDGNGSTFVFRRQKGGGNIGVSHCVRTKICNFKMDYDWQTEPLGAIVKMTGMGKEGEKYYWDFDLVDYKEAGRDYEFAHKQVRIADFENWNNKTRAIGAEKVPSMGFGFGPDQKGPELKWLSGNSFRAYVNDWYGKRIKANAIDKYYRIQHYYYGLGGFALHANTHFTMQDVRIYSCKGHAIHIGGTQKNYQLINVDILPPENDKFRVITCTADHLHVTHSRGNFKMIDCDFALGADDCINVHDITAFGVKSGENEITIRTRNQFAVGECVELVESNYAPTGFKAKVVKTDYKDKNNRRIIFDKKIPDPKYDGFVMFNDKYDSSNLIVRNCSFAKNRARGLLILTKNITVENCRFYHTQMGAIKFETGYTMNIWCEGYGVRNAVVRNCVFDSANAIDRAYQNKARDVFMGAYLRRDPSLEQSSYPVIRDILFENNTFNDSYGVVALISSAKNITFRNNTFTSKTPRIVQNYYRSAFYVNCARDIKIINNTWIASPLAPNVGVFYDNATVKNLTFEGNVVKDK